MRRKNADNEVCDAPSWHWHHPKNQLFFFPPCVFFFSFVSRTNSNRPPSAALVRMHTACLSSGPVALWQAGEDPQSGTWLGDFNRIEKRTWHLTLAPPGVLANEITRNVVLDTLPLG